MNISSIIDYIENYNSPDNKLTRDIKGEKLDKVSKICTNYKEVLKSKDFYKFLEILLKNLKFYNSKQVKRTFIKLSKNKKLNDLEKENIISFLKDIRIRERSKEILKKIKFSPKYDSKTSEELATIPEFISKITWEQWFDLFESYVLDIIWETKIWVEKIINNDEQIEDEQIEDEQIEDEQIENEQENKEKNIKDEEYIIWDELVPEKQLNDLVEQMSSSNNTSLEEVIIPEIVEEDRIWDELITVLEQWFEEVTINLQKKLYYKLWFKVDSFSWEVEDVFEWQLDKNKIQLGVEEAISKQVLVSPDYWSIKKWEITEFIGWKYEWQQIFSFNALTQEAKNNWIRIPSVEELDSIINEIGIDNFIQIAPWFRSWKDNRFKLYDRYIHYWTNSKDEDWKQIYISIDVNTKVKTREETDDLSLGFSPFLVKDEK